MSTYRFSATVFPNDMKVSSAMSLAKAEAKAALRAVCDQCPGLNPVIEEDRITYSQPARTDFVLRVDGLPWLKLLPIVTKTIEGRTAIRTGRK